MITWQQIKEVMEEMKTASQWSDKEIRKVFKNSQKMHIAFQLRDKQNTLKTSHIRRVK